MKKIYFIIALILNSLVTFSAQTEKLNQLFKDFEKNGGVTSIDIKKPMFNLLNSIDLDDEYLGKIKPIMSQVDGLKILIIPKITFPEDLKSENVENIKLNEKKTARVNKALNDLNFNELMSLNSDGASMKFLAENEKNDTLENLVFNIDSNDENIILMMNGKMKMEDVNKIINSSEAKTSSSSTTTVRNSFNSDSNSSYLSGESRNVGEFSGIHASTGVVVNFKQGNRSDIKIIADADKLQYIITKVEDGILKVYIDNKGQKNLKFKNMSVNVSAPKIETIKASSGAVFNAIDDLNEENIFVEISSGSVVNGNFNTSKSTNVKLSSGGTINTQINSESIYVKGSSGSIANLNGNANLGSIDISSGAVCNAAGFKFKTLKAEATSGATISAHAVGELSVTASSGGTIKYKGNPKIDSNISKMSGGSLKPIN